MSLINQKIKININPQKLSNSSRCTKKKQKVIATKKNFPVTIFKCLFSNKYLISKLKFLMKALNS